MNASNKNTKPKQPQALLVDPKLCPAFKDVNTGHIIKNALFGGDLAEGQPIFNQLTCEDVISGKNNTWIVLGRDRPGGAISGNINATQAGAIDIVVGRMGQQVRQCLKDGNKIYTDPIFSGDAGRIYISQKTAIDKNFNLTAGTVGSPGLDTDGKTVAQEAAESGIAIKADQVRVVARRSIKLVTMGLEEGPSGGEDNYRSIQGINIIAGNNTTGKNNMQPFVKGINLKDALTKLSKLVEEVAGVAHQALLWQDETNAALADHFHIWGNGAQPTSVSHPLSTVAKNTVDAHADTSMSDYETVMEKIAKFRANYLFDSGDKYINSRWNYVN